MPTYEYECAKCGNRFERFQSIQAAPLKTCPACKGRVRRVISGGAGLLFKGSGFYITDYRSEGYKKAADAERSAGKKPEAAPAKDKPKGEAKPSKDKKA